MLRAVLTQMVAAALSVLLCVKVLPLFLFQRVSVGLSETRAVA
jgi:hypothetical protein